MYSLLNLIYRKLFTISVWTLAINDSSLVDIKNKDNWTIRKPSLRFSIADPFLICYEKHTFHIMYESINFISGKGIIKLGKFDSNLNELETKIVLEKPYHLSFPSLFEIDSKKYLLCESAESNEATAYQLDKEYNILGEVYLTKGRLLDPVIFKHADKNYLLASTRKDIQEYEIVIFPFENLALSKDKEINYIVNKGYERNAGSIINYEGKKIRPGQILEPNYGSGIVFNEIQDIDEGIREKLFITLLPEDISTSSTGVHTVSNKNIYNVVDLRYEKFYFLAFLIKAIRILRKEYMKVKHND